MARGFSVFRRRSERLATREPAVAIWRRLRLGKPGVRELRVACLLFDPGPVAKGDLIHGVRAPVGASHVLARADRQDRARGVSGSGDHEPRLGGAMQEVPLPQGPLLALNDQERLAGENEEALLIGFPVV